MPRRKADRVPRQTSKVEPSSDLRLLLAFLNMGMEDLHSPRALADWLEQREVVTPGAELGKSDLELTIEVREATRTLLVRGSSSSVDAAAARLDQVMTGATLRTRFGAGGRTRLEPSPRGLDARNEWRLRISSTEILIPRMMGLPPKISVLAVIRESSDCRSMVSSSWAI